VQRHSAEQISRRYDRLALIYGPLSVALMLRRRTRDEAVRRLRLGPGDSVLEVGSGTGANLGRLVGAVGPAGSVTGIDLSPAMLERAEGVRAANGWENVTLLEQDAGRLDGSDRFDAVLFSLSYSVLPEPRRTLEAVWERLRPEGSIVIMDAGLPGGRLGLLLRPLANAVSRATVLGDPDSRPWEDIAGLGGAELDTVRFQAGTYFVCSARKPG
jgi:demethylmenaquinone methyltransferase/2-methoxy-6-polyprenyl-1,4-benzoquinol methylase